MSDSRQDSPQESLQPTQVPDFDLVRRIGEGGFGEVWVAVNRTTGQLRAVKLIALARSSRLDPAGREIGGLTRLESGLPSGHPNLLDVHHVGKTPQTELSHAKTRLRRAGISNVAVVENFV